MTSNEEATDYLIDTSSLQSNAKRRKYVVYVGIMLLLTIVLIIVIVVVSEDSSNKSKHILPVMITTWGAGAKQREALYVGFTNLTNGGFSLEAVLTGVRYCQLHCGGNVGVLNPNFDSLGQVTQHAMVIYGPTYDSGAVANVQDVADAVGLAYHVMLYTDHSLLAGPDATRFAKNFNDTFRVRHIGLQPQKNASYYDWKAGGCTTNFYKNVEDDQRCYPYTKKPISGVENHNDFTGCDQPDEEIIDSTNSDSIAMIAIDRDRRLSLATSANGLTKEIAGRVSDAAVVGSGGFIDNDVGACVATGNGDVLQRFAPSKAAVMYMKTGSSVHKAAKDALREITDGGCFLQTAIVCVDKDGKSGVAYYSKQGGDIPYARIDSKTKPGKVQICFSNDKCDTVMI